MKAKDIFILSIVLLLSISLTRIRYVGDAYPGQELELYTSILNSQNDEAKDVRVVVDFPELGYAYNFDRFDVADRDHYGKISTIYIPEELKSGEYLFRITASNDEQTTRKFRYIIVE